MPLIQDPDMLLTCDVATKICETLGLFVDYGEEGGNSLEFSDVRHSQYSTLVLLYEMMKTLKEVPVQPEAKHSNNVGAGSNHITYFEKMTQKQLDDYWASHCVNTQENNAALESSEQQEKNTHITLEQKQETNSRQCRAGGVMRNQRDERPSPYMHTLNKKDQDSCLQ